MLIFLRSNRFCVGIPVKRLTVLFFFLSRRSFEEEFLVKGPDWTRCRLSCCCRSRRTRIMDSAQIKPDTAQCNERCLLLSSVQVLGLRLGSADTFGGCYPRKILNTYFPSCLPTLFILFYLVKVRIEKRRQLSAWMVDQPASTSGLAVDANASWRRRNKARRRRCEIFLRPES